MEWNGSLLSSSDTNLYHLLHWNCLLAATENAKTRTVQSTIIKKKQTKKVCSRQTESRHFFHDNSRKKKLRYKINVRMKLWIKLNFAHKFVWQSFGIECDRWVHSSVRQNKSASASQSFYLFFFTTWGGSRPADTPLLHLFLLFHSLTHKWRGSSKSSTVTDWILRLSCVCVHEWVHEEALIEVVQERERQVNYCR